MQHLFYAKKLFNLLVLLLLGWPVLLLSHSPCLFNNTPTDWQKTSKACSLCEGYYVPFYEPIPNFSQSTELPIEIEFEQGEMFQVGRSHWSNAQLVQGLRWWEADHITFNRDKHHWQASAEGSLIFHQPNMSVWGNSAFYDEKTGYLRVTCGDFRWYPRHARGRSAEVEMLSQEEIVLHDASFTTCPPNNNSWQLNAKKITLYPKEGRAKAKSLYLTTHHTPIFYWPYLNYPIDNKRHSGFLFPMYTSSSQSGIGIAVPYYFNLAPNYDLTLTTKASAKRGMGLASNFRYLTDKMKGALYIDYLPNDTAYQRFYEETINAIPPGYTPLDPRILGIKDNKYRAGIGFDHHMDFNKKWALDINYHRVSDDNFFVDLGNDIHTTSIIHLPQRAMLNYQGQHWSHHLRVEEYQVLQPFKGSIVEEIYRRQPQWRFMADYPTLWQSLYFNITGEITHFTHPGDPLTEQSKIEGSRFYIQPAFHRTFRSSWAEVTPTIYLDAVTYNLETPPGLKTSINTHPNRVAPIYTLDAKIFFERQLAFRGVPLVQTLTPRVFYTYIPYRDQHEFPNFDSGIIKYSYAQLFRYNRFSGKDRLNEANQVSLSLTSSLLSQDSSFEWFRIGVGQLFYFTPERVFLCDPLAPSMLCNTDSKPRISQKHSNLLSEFAFYTPGGTQFGAFVEWGFKQSVIQQTSVFLHTKLFERYLFNLNYYFTRTDLKQFNNTSSGTLDQGDISLFVPLSTHFSALARFHYDFKFSQFVELLGGIEYDTCCFATQLVVSRYRQLGNAQIGREYANQIMLQFVFKGLSNLEINQAEQKLKQKIPGFEPLAQRAVLPALGSARRR